MSCMGVVCTIEKKLILLAGTLGGIWPRASYLGGHGK